MNNTLFIDNLFVYMPQYLLTQMLNYEDSNFVSGLVRTKALFLLVCLIVLSEQKCLLFVEFMAIYVHI